MPFVLSDRPRRLLLLSLVGLMREFNSLPLDDRRRGPLALKIRAAEDALDARGGL